MRSYRDLLCGAIGFTIVIIAILNVALNALDVLAIKGVTTGSLVFHFNFLSKQKFFSSPIFSIRL